MTQYNKVILIGNLTRDVELKQVGSDGTSLAKFGIAVNENYTTSSGEKKTRTAFVDVVAWGRLGETIAKWFGKGKAIMIEGRLDYSSWTDSATGKQRSKLEVAADQFRFLGDKGDSQPNEAGEAGAADKVPF